MSKVICLIDDDELVRAHMARALEAEGFTVLDAENAQQGLRLVATKQPDAILIDLIMPERDGIETIGEIRKRWPHIPIVAISGGGRVGPALYLDLARRLGATACLSKPLDMTEFKRAIAAPIRSRAGDESSEGERLER